MTYFDRFESYVYTYLGGLEMAEEFMCLHPYFRGKIRQAAHRYGKDSAPVEQAAWLWFHKAIHPQLVRDRADAQKTFRAI